MRLQTDKPECEFSEEHIFRDAVDALIDSYIEDEKSMRDLPIFQADFDNRIDALLTMPLSSRGEGLQGAVTLFNEYIKPNLVRNSHARFFNWVVGGRTPAAVLGDFYVTVFDQIVMLCGHGVSSQIENQAISWLLDLFDLSTQQFQGIFTTGATESNLCALAAARQWHGERQGVNVSEEGLSGLESPMVVAGQPHCSIDKAMQILGIGRRRLIRVTNDGAQMDLLQLEELLKENASVIVVASCGEVNTGGTDNLEAIAKLCREYKAWLHVDAAFGIFARCHPGRMQLTKGIEFADSITGDGHKMGNVPYASGFLFINKKNYAYLTKSFSAVAPYLSGNHDHPMNTRVGNSQRFLGLPFWLSLLTYGKSGYQDMVIRQCSFAVAIGAWIECQDEFELMMPVAFNIVLFRHKMITTSDENQRLIKLINATNQLSLSGTIFNGVPALRIAVSNWRIHPEYDLQPVCAGLLAGSQGYLQSREKI